MIMAGVARWNALNNSLARAEAHRDPIKTSLIDDPGKR